MSNFLDRGIQQVSAVAIIFVATSYSFTLGYLASLEIPETPEYLEATNAFIRVIFYVGVSTAIGYVILPIFIFLVLIYGVEELISKRCKENCKSFIMYLAFIVFTTTLAFCMYSSGKNYFNDKVSFFPMGYLFDQKQIKRPIVWFGKKATYYLNCDVFQYELRGVNDEKETVFIKEIDSDSIFSLCE